ncbi:TPA: DUF1642 domain-containing protein [Streptococcus suis]|nr:DUF1642 domain-containing protein [Streptococcus suis]
MNKQEAIEAIKNIDTLNINDIIAGQSVDMVIKNQVIDLISKIHEPQKVVVPKHIADKIGYCKDTEGYGLFHAMDYCYQYKDSAEWLEDNQETFAQAWLFGFEIEQEKLYTVELFNGQPLVEVNNILYFSSDLAALNASVSKDKLEQAGFGWVFDCDGVKVEEVEEN